MAPAREVGLDPGQLPGQRPVRHDEGVRGAAVEADRDAREPGQAVEDRVPVEVGAPVVGPCRRLATLEPQRRACRDDPADSRPAEVAREQEGAESAIDQPRKVTGEVGDSPEAERARGTSSSRTIAPVSLPSRRACQYVSPPSTETSAIREVSTASAKPRLKASSADPPKPCRATTRPRGRPERGTAIRQRGASRPKRFDRTPSVRTGPLAEEQPVTVDTRVVAATAAPSITVRRDGPLPVGMAGA